MSIHRRKSSGLIARSRSGATVLESATAVLVLGVLLIAMAKMLFGITRHVGVYRQRIAAEQTCANLLELAMTAPWSQLDAQNLGRMSEQYLADAGSKDAGYRVAWRLDEAEPGARWLTVRIDWDDRQPAAELSVLRTRVTDSLPPPRGDQRSAEERP